MSHAGHAHGGPAAAAAPQVAVGTKDQMVDLTSIVDVEKSQILNADPSTNLKSILGLSPGIIRSDSDHEMLLVVQFREPVKLRGIKFTANESKSDSDTDAGAPATVKLFVQKPNLNFSDADAEEATETLQLTPEQTQKGEEVKLKFTKFQSVHSLTIFIQSNQGDEPVTFLNQIQFVGAPKESTNMKNLKAQCDC